MKPEFKKVLRPALRRRGKDGERVLMPYPAKAGQALEFLPDGGELVTATSSRDRQYWLTAIRSGDVEVIDAPVGDAKTQGRHRAKPKATGNRPALGDES